MFANALTTKCCQEIVANILTMPGWSLARIGESIDNSPEYVLRIQAGLQSFQVADVESLAKACGKRDHELIFDSVDRESLSPENRELYDLVKKEVDRHRRFSEIISRKPGKKARRKSTATSAKTSTKPAARRAFARS